MWIPCPARTPRSRPDPAGRASAASHTRRGGLCLRGTGLTGRVQWTHPNFTGGARSLTPTLEAQSGAGAIGTEAEQLLRGSLSLTQPYVFAPGISFIVGPWAEYRNDLQDQSAAIGIDATLVRRLGPLSSIALRYRFSARHIYEYHFGDVSAGNISLLELLSVQFPALIDSLGHDERKSTVTLAGSFSRVDNLSDPRLGWAAASLGGGHGARGLQHGPVRPGRSLRSRDSSLWGPSSCWPRAFGRTPVSVRQERAGARR